MTIDGEAGMGKSLRRACAALTASAVAAAALWLLSGCEDRPLPEPPDTKVPTAITIGPYACGSEPGKFTVCYLTNRPVQGGVRIHGHGGAVFRSAKPECIHTIPVFGLKPGGKYGCEVLLPGKDGEGFFGGTPNFEVSALDGPEGDAEIAIISGGGESPEALAKAINRVSGLKPKAVLLLGSQSPDPTKPSSWGDSFLAPYGKSAAASLLVRGPGDGLVPAQILDNLFPGKASSGRMSLDAGSLHLTLVGKDEVSPGKLASLLAWMEKDLAASNLPWKAVVMPMRFVSSTGQLDAKMLDAFGSLFERYGVAYVLCQGSGIYQRSRPIGTENGRVQYILMGGLTGGKAPAAMSDYASAQDGEPGLVLLRADAKKFEGLRLNLDGTGGKRDEGIDLGFAGGVADRFSSMTKDTDGEGLSREEITSAIFLQQSRKRELSSVVRQAARAVADPSKPGALRIIVANPMPKTFTGKLRWEGLDGAAFKPTPTEVIFSLQPGEETRSVFNLTPVKGGQGMPRLVAADDSGLASIGDLALTKLRVVEVPRINEVPSIDGQIIEKGWVKGSLDPGTFTWRQDNSEASKDDVMARIAACPEGLVVAFRCRFPENRAPKPAIKDRDGDAFREESVEIFIDPGATGREFFQFSITAGNIALDANSRLGRVWNPSWQHAVLTDKEHYDVEVLIPYRAVGRGSPPAAGETWGINLTRNSYATGAGRVAQLAPTGGGNDRPGCYASCVFK